MRRPLGAGGVDPLAGQATTDKRSIESRVEVDDGAILVLCALIEDRYTSNQSKVPLLGGIPYLGGLFRTKSRNRKHTNLMVFLCPVVSAAAKRRKSSRSTDRTACRCRADATLIDIAARCSETRATYADPHICAFPHAYHPGPAR